MRQVNLLSVLNAARIPALTFYHELKLPKGLTTGEKVSVNISICVVGPMLVRILDLMKYFGLEDDWPWIKDQLPSLGIESHFSKGSRWVNIHDVMSLLVALTCAQPINEKPGFLSKVIEFTDKVNSVVHEAGTTHTYETVWGRDKPTVSVLESVDASYAVSRYIKFWKSQSEDDQRRGTAYTNWLRKCVKDGCTRGEIHATLTGYKTPSLVDQDLDDLKLEPKQYDGHD